MGALAARLDGTGREWQHGLRKRLRSANRYLRAADLPPHREPGGIDAERVLTLRVGGYGTLHWLRRRATHLRAGLEPEPWPVLSNPIEDPLLVAYGDEGNVELRLGPWLPSLLPREGEFARLRSSPAVEPSFDPLFFHSDGDGFHLPIGFDFVLATLEDGIGCIGSSMALGDECEVMARFLELPVSLHPESPEAESLIEGDSDPSATRWRRSATESLACRTLHLATRSIELGAALVFH